MNLRTPSSAPKPIPIGERGKALVRQVAESYLQAYAPDELDEFRAIFDATYDYLSKPPAQHRVVTVRFGGAVHATPAIPDTSPAVGVTWTADQAVRAVASAPADAGASQALAELAPQLVAHTGQPQWVDGIIKILTKLTTEVQSLKELIKFQEKMALPERGALAGGVWASFGQAASGSGSFPDLLLIIEQRSTSSGVELAYQLHTRNPQLGPGNKPFGAVALGQTPDAYVASLFTRIQGQLAYDGSTRREKLAGIGIKLFEDLLPRELQRRLWSVACQLPPDAAPAITLQIVSDATWIPWQLLKIQDPDAAPGGGAGPFFAEAFGMTVTPAAFDEQQSLPLRRIALVVPGGSGLPRAAAERKAMLDLDPTRFSEVTAQFDEVVQALAAGRHDGWHFTGHGLVAEEGPDSWSFQLDDAGLEASDLYGQARGLGQTHPLIFLNACHGAAGSFALVGISGLATSFLRVGAGALIGAHWEILDTSAVEFARAFYRHFFAGTPFAESVRQARLDLRRQSTDASWLAYAAFGHPLAKCPQ